MKSSLLSDRQMNQEDIVNDDENMNFPDDLFSEKAAANVPNAAHKNVNEPQNSQHLQRGAMSAR